MVHFVGEKDASDVPLNGDKLNHLHFKAADLPQRQVNAYRLRVSADAPAKQFWSLTVCDVDTRCLIRNPQRIADRSSYEPAHVRNPDGTVDLHVGPTAPVRGFHWASLSAPLGFVVGAQR